MSDFLYDVLICHNSADKGEVDTIANFLETKGIRLWYDKFELRPGTHWREFVQNDWPKIQSIAVFLGRNGIGEGQEFEINTLLPRAKRNIQFIIPVLLPSFTGEKKQLPKLLQSLIYVDFRKPENKPLGQLLWAISGENPNDKLSIGAYYRNTDALNAKELKLVLSMIISKDHHTVQYPKEARENVVQLYEDPENSDEIIEFYTGKSISKNHYRGMTLSRRHDVLSWNMDHIWPKAFGFAKYRNIVSDLHNIVPCETVTDIGKGAGFFSDPILDVEKKELPIEPSRKNDMRGAISRMCLYMAVRYTGQNKEPKLELDEERPVRGENHIGSLRTLLYWNRLVDVTVAERRRNHIIMGIQGNRNPFVDQPEFATRIWYPV